VVKCIIIGPVPPTLLKFQAENEYSWPERFVQTGKRLPYVKPASPENVLTVAFKM